MTDKITINFNHPVCGGRIIWDEDAPDTARTHCNKCGEDGPTLGELKARALKESKAQVIKLMKDTLKDVPGIKWK